MEDYSTLMNTRLYLSILLHNNHPFFFVWIPPTLPAVRTVYIDESEVMTRRGTNAAQHALLTRCVLEMEEEGSSSPPPPSNIT